MFSAIKLSPKKPCCRRSRIVDTNHAPMGGKERGSKPRAEMFGHKMLMSTAADAIGDVSQRGLRLLGKHCARCQPSSIARKPKTQELQMLPKLIKCCVTTARCNGNRMRN